MENFKVYYLTTEHDKFEPRYIGYTKRELEERLIDHLSQAKYKKDGKLSKKNKWIRSRLKMGQRIIINPLVQNIQNMETALAKEIDAIAALSKRFDLKNGNAGGSGRKEYRPTENTNDKISRKQRARIGRGVVVLNKEQKIIYEFDAVIDATKTLKIKSDSVIGNLKDRTKSKTYIFVYKDEYDPNVDYSSRLFENRERVYHPSEIRRIRGIESAKRKLTLVDKCSGRSKDFNSIEELCVSLGITRCMFNHGIRTRVRYKGKFDCYEIVYKKTTHKRYCEEAT